MTKEETQRRRDELIAQMTERLRPVCAEWPEDAFSQMVARLADITLRYEGISALTDAYDRRTTDRLIAELHEAIEKSESARDTAAPERDPATGVSQRAGEGGTP